MIRVEGLVKRAGDTYILRNVCFEVAPKSVLGIIGASGSGKTTLLRCLNGLERIDGGALDCDWVRLEAGLSESDYHSRVKALRRRVGMVFQHLHLFPHLTVLGNVVEAPVHVLRVGRSDAESRARELLESVGLKHAAHRYPESLSGGEQQRVAIARALAMRPGVLLFDEPTSALDLRRAAEMRTLLRGFVERGHTMVIVSHAISFLEGLADYLLYMEGGGAVEYAETDTLLRAPREPGTRDFLQQARWSASPIQ
ncbi:MAG: amino acid ABC transporter ATP-binding protein [Acidobacteriota bacterium]|nr:amino acid ABC transporter ATP-binding protein [Acidobacteriota bacterium]